MANINKPIKKHHNNFVAYFRILHFRHFAQGLLHLLMVELNISLCQREISQLYNDSACVVKENAVVSVECKCAFLLIQPKQAEYDYCIACRPSGRGWTSTTT